MTLLINSKNKQKDGSHFKNVSFQVAAEQIIAGFLECPDLKEYYFKLYENEAKAFEYQTLTSH